MKARAANSTFVEVRAHTGWSLSFELLIELLGIGLKSLHLLLSDLEMINEHNATYIHHHSAQNPQL